MITEILISWEMSKLICPNLNNTDKLRMYIRSLSNYYVKRNSLDTFHQIWYTLRKTKLKRELSYYFVMEIIKRNCDRDDIQNILDYHKSFYNQPAKSDIILYETLPVIINFFNGKVHLNESNMTWKEINIKKKLAFTDIYNISKYMSMKPIYVYAKY